MTPSAIAPRSRGDLAWFSPWMSDVAAVGVVAGVFRLVFPHGYLGYDATYALVWGRDLADGNLPDYGLAGAPTPHPLANAVSGLASLAGDRAGYDVIVALSYIAFGVIVWATFRLGQRLFSTGAGTVAAMVVATSFPFVSRAQASFLDIPFVALVLLAALLEARRPRRGLAVMVLLAFAGLLRPEGWGLSAVYWVYLWPGLDSRRRAAYAALGTAPVALWALGDLIVTGDPLFSLTGAREVAQSTGFAQVTHGDKVTHAADSLRDILRLPGVLAGIAGVAVALACARRRAALPLALLGVTGVLFGVQLAADVPLSDRLLFVPAVMLALFCGFAALGWRTHPSGRVRTTWAAAGVAFLAVLAITAPKEVDRLEHLDSLVGDIHSSIDGMRELSTAPGLDLRRCSPLTAPNRRAAPYVAHFAGISPAHVQPRTQPGPRRGLFLTPATRRAAILLQDDSGAVPRGIDPPPGFGRVASNATWVLYAKGCSPAP